MLAFKMDPTSGSAMGHTLPLYLHIQMLQEILYLSGQTKKNGRNKASIVKRTEATFTKAIKTSK